MVWQRAGMSAESAEGGMSRQLAGGEGAGAANRLREHRERARRNADREAKKIVALAVQRIAY